MSYFCSFRNPIIDALCTCFSMSSFEERSVEKQPYSLGQSTIHHASIAACLLANTSSSKSRSPESFRFVFVQGQPGDSQLFLSLRRDDLSQGMKG